jgi:hypothetical protein
MPVLVQNVNALDKSGSADYQIYARARYQKPDQRTAFANDLYEIMSETDSPRLFALVAELLVGMEDTDYLGAD